MSETNERGNLVERSFRDADRYLFDWGLCSGANGWEQWDTDQDAWYFGVWVNHERREILTYAEGDITRVTCPTLESYRAELAAMADFYGPAPPTFSTIDDDGTLTRYYNPRPAP